MRKKLFLAVDSVKQLPYVWLLPLVAILFIILGQVSFLMLAGLISGMMGYNLLPHLMSLDTEIGQLLGLTSFSGIALLVFVWIKGVEGLSIRELGFYRHKAVKELFLGSLVGGLLYSFVLLVQWGFGAVRLQGVDFSLDTLGYVLLTIPFWLLQGGTEELVTRAWLLPRVTYRSNLLVGILMSSGLFAVLHLANPGISFLSVLNLFLFGLFASLYMIDRDSIWGVVGIHGVWNFVQGNVFGVEVSGNVIPHSLLTVKGTELGDWLTGGAFGTEGSLVTSLALLVASYLVYRRIDFAKLILKKSLVEDGKQL